MNKPTLSVIMANYNHAHYIGEALEAILSQSFRPLEVIVVDDSSTDNSVEVIEKFAKRNSIIRLLRNKQNMGVNISSNRGLEHASGDYIYCAGADDKVLPGLFEKSMNILTQYPQAWLCCSDPVCFDGRTGIVRQNRLYLSDEPRYFSPGELVELMQQECVHIAGHTSLVKRLAFVEAGGYVQELRWHADWFAFLVIAFRHGICYIPEPLAALRVSQNSYSAGRTQKHSQQEVLNYLLNILKSPEYSDILPLFKKSGALSTFHLQILRIILKNPEYWEFLNPLLIRRSIWYSVLKILSPITPPPVKRVYRNIRDIRSEKRL